MLNIEKASTTGGMGPEFEALNKRIATLVANKTFENYSHVMTYLRARQAVKWELTKGSIALRYGCPYKDMQKFCACDKDNSIDHALSCKKGS